MKTLAELRRDAQTQGGAATANPMLLAQALRSRQAYDRPQYEGASGALEYAAGVLGGVPGIGDVAGFANDVNQMRRDPEQRTLLNYGLTAAGLLPFVPAAISSGKRAVTSAEQAVLDKFGNKHIREAELAKRVQRTADLAADAPAALSAARAPRTRVEPDVFRTMQAEQGEDAVMRAARAGQHLRPDGRGGYIGGPRTVNSPQALGALRRRMDSEFVDAAEAVAMAENRAGTPERIGTWYDRAKQGIAESSEPYQLPRTLEQHAVYSAGVSPESESGFALKHLNSRALGEPAMAYRGAPMRNLDNAVAEGRPAKLGFKIGEYLGHNDPRLPNAGLFGVNDFRRAQGTGYTLPDGSIWQGGVSATMHPFMDGETALQVGRANAAGVGGRTDWVGPHIQELPWVRDKAQDIYERGKNARFKGPEIEGVTAALRDANNTARDYFYKHTGSATHEAIPGRSTGHVPSMLEAPFDEKLTYSQAGRWDIPTTYTLPEAPTVGAGNRDALYSAVGFRQLPSIPSTGAYMNSAGQLETNPMTIARPLLDFPTGGGGGRVSPLTDSGLKAIERFRGVVDAQEASAYNMPNTMNAVKNRNALVLDTRRPQDPTTGAQPTAGQLSAAMKALEAAQVGAGRDLEKVGQRLEYGPPTRSTLNKINALRDASGGYGVSATSRGALLFPFDQQSSSAGLADILRRAGPSLTEAFPGAVQSKGVASTGFVPGIGKWGDDGVVPTAPFSGEATMGMLEEMARAPAGVAPALSESEDVRRIIREKIARDAALPGARQDIQNTRNFLAEADWNKAVTLIRKGMTPAAALAALGYSAASMAADEPR